MKKVFLSTNICWKSAVNPVDTYLFKASNGNTRTMCEIYSKLTINNGASIVNFEDISHIDLVFPLLTLNK